MDRSQIEALLQEVQTKANAPSPMPWIGSRTCLSKTSASPSSIIIARCAPACRR